MDYPTYRRQGLPVTSSLMQSLVKQINHRAKGTEMFWDRPQGAERILQIRAPFSAKTTGWIDISRNGPVAPTCVDRLSARQTKDLKAAA